MITMIAQTTVYYHSEELICEENIVMVLQGMDEFKKMRLCRPIYSL